jgi:hypothetical protein
MISTNGKLTMPAQSLTAAGAVAVAPATAASLPRTLWTAWKAYGHRIATYHTELLLSAVYFVVLGPSSLLARLSGKQLLDLARTPRASYWVPRKPVDSSLVGMRRQY